jgi:hypothetical protein
VADLINHPPHYTAHPSGVECIDIVEHMVFNVGAAVKYLWRAGLKGGADKRLEDLRKARWFIDREIQKTEREQAAAAAPVFVTEKVVPDSWARPNRSK